MVRLGSWALGRWELPREDVRHQSERLPAPEQARRLQQGENEGKSAGERRDLLEVIASLPESDRLEITALWDEYETAATPTARLAKGLDKLETILQHTQGVNPPGFDYRFNLHYGRQHTESPELLAIIRKRLDDDTEALAVAREQHRSI